MFRPHLVRCSHQLCKNETRYSVISTQVKRCYTSRTTIPPSSTGRRVALWGATLGGLSLVGAYFFWPDVSRSAPTYANVALSPTHFTPVTITGTEQCKDPSTRLMTLTVPRESILPLQEGLFAPIWSIFIKDDDIQVERPYTPLEGIDDQGRMKIWVKRYPKGEVGRWLHSKHEGDHIEIRGPLKTWPWQDQAWDEIVMISGGTGITPFYQLLYSTLLSGKAIPPKTHFTLLHSSRTPGELPPPEILEPLLSHATTNPGQLRVKLFVDELEGSDSETVPTQQLQLGRIGLKAVSDVLAPQAEASWWQSLLRLAPSGSRQAADKNILFLVCGPEPMINAVAGPYGRNYSQGPIGGVLGSLGCRQDQVWKL